MAMCGITALSFVPGNIVDVDAVCVRESIIEVDGEFGGNTYISFNSILFIY